jgi:6-phosphogluconolactonase
MYVSLQDDDQVLVLTLDSGSGKISPKGRVPVAGGPSPMAISPDRQVLYVGHRNVPGITSFRIDPQTGDLTQSGTVSPEAAPTFLSTDRSGRYLLSSYYQGAHAAVHPIGADGAVGGPPIEWLETAIGAHAMQTDPSNKYAFVPHIDNRGGPNAIFQFKFDPNTGRLTPNSPPRVGQPAGTGPRHFCFHPARDILYFSNEQGSSVTGYNFDPAGGTLSPFQTISTLPAGYRETNSCSQIQISPSGKFLFAPNRGHNSIASFSVDAASGRLTAIGHVSTEDRPSAFSLDPQGRFVVSAGSETDRLASYRVNVDSGELIPLETYLVGKRPMWVLITDLGG